MVGFDWQFPILQLAAENSEEYIEYLVSIGRLDEAALKLAEVVNNVCSG